jgi:outer membrane biogenesis lipoprotein LolB
MLLVAGCATAPPPEAPPATGVYLEAFTLSARMSIRVADRADNVRIEWRHTPTEDVMRFFTPFGSQLAEVSATPERSVLRRGDAAEYAASFAVLTRNQLGVALDAREFARWVQGFDLDASRLPATPVQAPSSGEVPRAWRIVAENFQVVPNQPGARYARRLVATDNDVVLRIVIDEFRAL